MRRPTVSLLSGAICLAAVGTANAVVVATGDGTQNTTAPSDDFGFANVGRVKAGVDLAAVVIDGDLGRIDAGDAVTSTPGLGSLRVQSLGALGTTTQLLSAGNGDIVVGGKLITGQVLTIGTAGLITLINPLNDFQSTVNLTGGAPAMVAVSEEALEPATRSEDIRDAITVQIGQAHLGVVEAKVGCCRPGLERLA